MKSWSWIRKVKAIARRLLGNEPIHKEGSVPRNLLMKNVREVNGGRQRGEDKEGKRGRIAGNWGGKRFLRGYRQGEDMEISEGAEAEADRDKTLFIVSGGKERP